jgi:type IV secretory pathway TrbD component
MTRDRKSLTARSNRPSLAGGAKDRAAILWGRAAALAFCATFWSAVWVHVAPAIYRFLIRSLPEIEPVLFRAGILTF